MLPNDVIWEIALRLTLSSLHELIRTCKRVSSLLSNDLFWKTKYLRDFGEHKLGLSMPWKEKYRFELPGEVYAIGDNTKGFLGLGYTSATGPYIPTKIPGIKAKCVIAGWDHAIIIDPEGSAWAFGLNNRGQLGLGDTETRISPTRIPELKVKSGAAGESHTLLIDLNTSAVWAFGDNQRGQLGLSAPIYFLHPTQVEGLKARSIAVYENRSLVIDSDRSVWVFGYTAPISNLYNFNRLISRIPVKITGIEAETVITSMYKTLIVDTKGVGWLIKNEDFEFFEDFIPLDMEGITQQDSKRITLKTFRKEVWNLLQMIKSCTGYTGNDLAWLVKMDGHYHQCVIDFRGNVWVSGENYFGVLGLGDTKRRDFPTRIPNFKAKDVSIGLNTVFLLAPPGH